MAYIETGLPARSAKFCVLQAPGSSVLRGESARTTRKHWRTKLRRRRRRGAESLRSSHAVDSVAQRGGALIAVRPPRITRHDYYEGIPCLGAAATATSYVNVRASFSPKATQNRVLGVSRGANLAPTRVGTASKFLSHGRSNCRLT